MTSFGPSRHGALWVLAAAVLWSTAGAAIKLCSLSGWQIAFGRSLVATLFIGLAFPASRIRPSPKVLGVGLAYAATVTLFAVANKLTTAANSIFLQDTAPLYVAILGVLLLQERPSRGELLSAPLFLVGLSLFFLDQLTPGQRLGNGIALASGVAFALCIVGMRGLGGNNVAALLYGNLLASALTLPMALHGPAPGARDLLILAYLGVFQLGLAYVFFARGLQSTSALGAALLALLEPVLNPVWTFLLAHERPGRFAILGGGVILVATLWRALAAWPIARRGPGLKSAADTP
jgi:drug/metabolite transporter (DMT)-like permease